MRVPFPFLSPSPSGSGLAQPLTRRRVLALGSVAAASLVVPRSLLAQASPGWERLESARALIGKAQVRREGIALEMPLVSEDGSSVGVSVRVDSRMTAQDHVTEIHLFAPRNPTPEILALRLSPLSGRADIATRIRLNESQSVIAIARKANGEVLATERMIRITTSGCLMRPETYAAADEMRARIRVPQRVRPGETGEILTLINHPMETGLRQDSHGNPIPTRIIERFEASLPEGSVLVARFHRSLAANPYLRFHVAPVASGTMTFEWTEDTGRKTRQTEEIRLG